MPSTEQQKAISRVLMAIDHIRSGKMVIMVDDEDRENEGDLVMAAEHASAAHINFMAREARGLICLTLEPTIVDRLKLPMMGDSTKTHAGHGTAFTVSIEARQGVTTGISAADRAKTIQVAIRDNSSPDDLVVPGHVFPLKAKVGGVLERAGHTEGSVDLARMAALKGAGVICEIMNDDGTMARMTDLEAFSKKHSIPIVAIADIINYRLLSESLVEELGRQPVRTAYGVFESVLFRHRIDGSQHLALVKGEDFQDHVVDVRVHTERLFVDVFGDDEKGGRFRLDYGLKMLQSSERAALIYLTKPQSLASTQDELDELAADVDHGFAAKDQRLEHAPVDLRLVGTGSQILRALQIQKMRIHSASPRPLKGLTGFGLEVVETHIMDAAGLH